MSLPSGVSTCSCSVGSALDFFGNDVALSVTVLPVIGGTAKEIVHAETGRSLVSYTATFTAAAGQVVTFAVPHVNQAGFVDSNDAAVTMWAYKATITATYLGQSQTWVKNFQPLVGQATLDLDLVADGQITGQVSAPFPEVISVNGMTGIVVVPGGGGTGAVSSVAGRTGDVVLTKTDVGLNQVNNTSDAAKPVSAATLAQLNLKANDASVVHTSGGETIAGVKSFQASPIGPDPTQPQEFATKAYTDLAGGGQDATTSVKGRVMLANDLGGTASVPTTPTAVHVTGAENVSGVKTFSSSPIIPTPSVGATTAAANVAFVLANGGTPADASTTVKGIVQLAGALGGTAASPTTPTAVHITGAETIAGVKTFNASPIVPDPTTATQAANKGFADTTYAARSTLYDTGGLIFVALIPDFSASKLVSGTLAVDRVAPGTKIVLRKAAGVWPTRPSRSTGYSVEWVGPAPAPPEDSTHAITDVDFWLEDAS